MLNARIKDLRVQKGLNQVELAKKLQVTKQSISNWENDNILLSIEMLAKMADFFSVTTDYLLGRDNRQFIEITGLTPEQLTHIQQIINDIKFG